MGRVEKKRKSLERQTVFRLIWVYFHFYLQMGILWKFKSVSYCARECFLWCVSDIFLGGGRSVHPLLSKVILGKKDSRGRLSNHLINFQIHKVLAAMNFWLPVSPAKPKLLLCTIFAKLARLWASHVKLLEIPFLKLSGWKTDIKWAQVWSIFMLENRRSTSSSSMVLMEDSIHACKYSSFVRYLKK